MGLAQTAWDGCKFSHYFVSKQYFEMPVFSVTLANLQIQPAIEVDEFLEVPSREIIWISSTNYKPQASLHQQQLNVLFSYYKSPSKLLPSLSHPDRFIISPNQFILGQTIVHPFILSCLQIWANPSGLLSCATWLSNWSFNPSFPSLANWASCVSQWLHWQW